MYSIMTVPLAGWILARNNLKIEECVLCSTINKTVSRFLLLIMPGKHLHNRFVYCSVDSFDDFLKTASIVRSNDIPIFVTRKPD